MAQRTFDPAPPLLDHNMYRYQMSGGPSYVGQDNPAVQQQTSPLASILGLRHELPSVSPFGGANQTSAQPVGPTAEELTAMGFRVGDYPAPGAQRGDPTAAGVPGFDQQRLDQGQAMDVGGSTFETPPEGVPAPAPSDGSSPSGGGWRERLGPIMSGLGAGIASNNLAAGIPMMNNRRDIQYQRRKYEDAVAYQRQQDALELQMKQKANNATVGFLAKQFGENDPRVQLARDNPAAAGVLLAEALKGPDEPTPYTDMAKAQMDLKNGLISQEMYQQMMEAAQLGESPDFKETGVLRREYLQSPVVRKYDVVDMQYGNLLDAARSAATDSSGLSAIKIVYSYMKMLDPDSAVREGEVAMPNQVGNIPDRVWNLYNKIVEGHEYDRNRLAGFVNEARGIHDRAAAQLERENRYYQGIIQGGRIDPRLFPLRQPSRYPAFAAPGSTPPPQMTESPLPGPRMVPGDPGAPIPTGNPAVTITPGRR